MTIAAIVRAWEMAAAPSGAWSTVVAPTVAQNWNRVGVSRDGNTLVASKFGQIYNSGDKGLTWNAAAVNLIAVDIDVGDNGRMWVSANSNLYTSPAPGSAFVRSAISAATSTVAAHALPADSSKLYIAAGATTSLQQTIDNGATKTNITAPGTRNWTAVACSSSGQHVIAYGGSGSWYYSNDYGLTWYLQTPGISTGVLRLWISEDGLTVWAFYSPGSGTNGIFGKFTTGTVGSTPPATVITLPYVMSTASVKGMAVSGSGQNMLVAEAGQIPYESVNGGTNWIARTSMGVRNWCGADMSTDGQVRMLANQTAVDQSTLYLYK